MKKPASTKKAKTKSDKDFDELRKPAKLKPIKSKEPKRIKNPKLDDEELDMLDDDWMIMKVIWILRMMIFKSLLI